MKKVLICVLMSFWGMSLMAQTQFAVDYKDLPKDVQKYISKNYDGYSVDKAIQGESKKGKMSFCDVYVSKGTDKVKLIFDSDGAFVKKEIIPAQPAAAAPAAADRR